jgi:hypothetical protein
MIYHLKKQGFYSLAALMLAQLACRPVIAIGWEEFLLFLVVVALLLGPPVYRFFRRLEDFRDRKRRDR